MGTSNGDIMTKYDIIYDSRERETYTGTQESAIELAKKHGTKRNARTIAIFYAGTNRLVGRWERSSAKHYVSYMHEFDW